LVGGVAVNNQDAGESEVVCYKLYPLDSHVFDPALAMRFVSAALLAGGKMVFQIAIEQGGVEWRLVDRGAGILPEAMHSLIRVFFPEISVSIAEAPCPTSPEPSFYRSVTPYQMAAHYPFPLRYVDSIAKADPVVLLTRLMNSLNNQEQVLYSVYVAAMDPNAGEEGTKLITRRDVIPRTISAEGMTEAAFNALFNVRRATYTSELQKIAEAKLAQEQLARCFVLVQVDSPSQDRCDLLHGLCFICLLQTSSYEPWSNSLVPVDDFAPVRTIASQEDDIKTGTLRHIERWARDEDKRWRDFALILCPDEIAALWHFPGGELLRSQASNQHA
jgi:hypothetical protein